ncbi:MAG: FHA domain-containing protein [Chloroflexi bacterium]|nr:FHA domain-containing protein [Chloroflexota bacterium]
MHPNTSHDPFDLLSKFTMLRRSGVNRDEAWFQVLDRLDESLPEATRKEFLALARNWERHEGHKYHYRSQRDKHETLSREDVEQHEQYEAARTQYKQMTGRLEPAALRQYQQRGLEQVLNQVSAASQPVEPLKDPEYFGQHLLLLLFFTQQPQPLVVDVNGKAELYIGRSTPNSDMAPEIDLNVVNGGEYGVSRMHAAITRRYNKLLMADLGSMNYTRVNGVRILPNEIKMLKDGDEIWFGHLRCTIRFKQR